MIDGPFTEAKELIAGFWLWQVKSKEEAIEWVKRAPFDDTEVEVRQVFETEEFAPSDPTGELRQQEERPRAQSEQLSREALNPKRSLCLRLHPRPLRRRSNASPTYLFFDGCCEEAIEFYRSALGAEVTMLIRFKDSPEPCEPGMVPPGAEDKVMHMSFRIGDTTVLASDGRCLGQPSFQGFSLSLTVPSDAEAERLFAALADGGQVQMPLTKTFFSPRFGMVADRFGVCWMIVVAP